MVASRELFGVLADAQRVTVVSAPAGRTPRSVRTAHASLISDIRDLYRDGHRQHHRRRGATPGPTLRSELRVLRYLPTNLPVPEIASELVVSANTIRTHTRHVYDKVDAAEPRRMPARSQPRRWTLSHGSPSRELGLRGRRVSLSQKAFALRAPSQRGCTPSAQASAGAEPARDLEATELLGSHRCRRSR